MKWDYFYNKLHTLVLEFILHCFMTQDYWCPGILMDFVVGRILCLLFVYLFWIMFAFYGEFLFSFCWFGLVWFFFVVASCWQIWPSPAVTICSVQVCTLPRLEHFDLALAQPFFWTSISSTIKGYFDSRLSSPVSFKNKYSVSLKFCVQLAFDKNSEVLLWVS